MQLVNSTSITFDLIEQHSTATDCLQIQSAYANVDISGKTRTLLHLGHQVPNSDEAQALVSHVQSPPPLVCETPKQFWVKEHGIYDRK